jgi:glyoxylase-like metal-dependent hydrolase (beta-lactamase superfamily II)
MISSQSSSPIGNSVTQTLRLRSYEDGVWGLDSGYFRDSFDAVHLIEDGGELAIVDTGTQYSVPRILQSIKEIGLSPKDVRYILLTHIHLDHAGGAGLLAEHCPQAKVVVHPRGVRHLVGPSKLWQAVCKVYTQKVAERDYGGMVPINPASIVEATEDLSLKLGARKIHFWDAPGHALHHVFIVDEGSNAIFTGDTFGISYRELDSAQGAFTFVTSSPSQFDPTTHRASVRRVMQANPKAVYLTHYSELQQVQAAGEALLEQIEAYAELANRHSHRENDRATAIMADLQELLFEQIHAHGSPLSQDELETLLALDLRLNSDGLVCWLDRIKTSQ